MRSWLETLGGLWALFRLGVQTRFRFNGRYWRWRHETAFGNGEPDPAAKRHAALDYGRWVHRMRKLM